jgi:hypothetical protein
MIAALAVVVPSFSPSLLAVMSNFLFAFVA